MLQPTGIPGSESERPQCAGRAEAWTAALVLVLVVLIAYRPTVSSDFVRFDDSQYVIANGLVRAPTWSGVARVFSEVRKPSTVAGYYQPLTMVSLMADALITGGGEVSPAVCHLHNIVLHAVTCILVFLLLRHGVHGWGIPLILAGMFAIHPVTVESVAWISQRKTVLATPLALGSILCYLRHGEGGKSRWLVASIAFYFLATLGKPTIVLAPLVLPLLDIWPLKRPVFRHLSEKWPFAVIMLVMGYIAAISQASSIAALGIPNFTNLDVVRRWIALLSYNLMLYLGNVVWPLHLSPFREVPQSLSFADPPIAWSILGALALVVMWIVSWRRSKPLFVGLAAFALTLAPALGLLRLFDSCVADRFLYFPMIFLFVPAAAAVARIESISERRIRLLRYAVLLLSVPLLILMRAQQTIWRDGRTLWTHVIQTMPGYSIAYLNLGSISLAEHKLDEALDDARRGLVLQPDNVEIVSLLGQVQIERGAAGEAVRFLRDAVRTPLFPDAGLAYLSLGQALVVTGDLDAAHFACREAIGLGRSATLCYEQLGDSALQKAHRFEFAAECYRQAVKDDPENLTARWNIGTALEAAGNPAAALPEYEAALARYAEQGRPPVEIQRKVREMTRWLSTRGPTSAPTSSRS